MGEGGSLTAGERFDRLEKSLKEGLGRIEAKLDNKADAVVVTMLEERVKIIESGNTPLGRMYLQQFDNLVHRVDTIENTGSRQAQEAIREVAELTSTVTSLSQEARERAAVTKVEVDQSARRQRFLIGLVSFLNIVAAVGGIIIH